MKKYDIIMWRGDKMAYNKYIINGREMLNLDNFGMVDYNEYYIMLGKSYERREDITTKYVTIQSTNRLEEEPSVNYSVQYGQFLEKLKSVNPEMFNKKMSFFKDYLKELKEEENIYREEKNQLLSNGYLFDSDLKKYGYYIIKIDNNYFQYKRVGENNAKIDMGNKLLPQNANISSYKLVPITLEELQEIKSEVLRKDQSFEGNITRKPR